MEKLGNILAVWLHRQRSHLRGLDSRLGSLSLDGISLLIVLCFAIFPLTLYFIFNAEHYSWQQILAHYLITILLFAIGWTKARAMDRGGAVGDLLPYLGTGHN